MWFSAQWVNTESLSHPGGKLTYKQAPLLEFDGRSLVGSEVILRHVCRKGNLMGKTEAEQDQ